MYVYSIINFIKMIYLNIINIMENLRLEITINTYKINRIRKIQHLDFIIILKRKFINI